jgi:hypothetical protein
MNKIDQTVKNSTRLNSYTVNSNKDKLNTVNSNEKTFNEELNDLIEKHKITPEGIAQKLSEDLDDPLSIDYYLTLAKNTEAGRLLEALSIVLDVARQNKIKTKKAIYFIWILNRWGIRTKFKH